MFITVIATDPTIVLITDATVYADYGFEDLGVYYTPNELVHHHMPFIVERTGVFNNLDKYDLNGTYKNGDKNFSKRFISDDFKIIAESEGYYVIDFYMQTWAETGNLSVDFVPEIKGVSFDNYGNWAWFNSSWNKKVYISINHQYINENLRNFPIMVKLNSTFSNQADDGASIRFVALDNTSVMPLEIELWTYGGTSYVWTMLTNINSSTYQSFWLYFNNTAATSIDQVPYGGVWNDNFTFVCHMDETASDNLLIDSTSNRYNSTSTLYDPSYSQTGKVHHGIYYNDGTDDEAHIIPTIMTNADYLTGFSMECWAKFNNMTVDKVPLALNDDVFAFLGTYQDGSDFKMRFTLKEGDASNQYATTTTLIDKSYWYYIGGRFTGTKMYLYLNGTYEDWDPVTGLNADTDDNLVGGYDAGASIYGSDSVVDEVRISNCDRNTSWFRATYHNINESTTNGSFLIWGSIREFEGDVVFSNPYPAHNSVNLVPPVETTNITVVTNEGNTLNLTWQSNHSGSWNDYGANNSVGNGTYNQSTDDIFTELGTNYYWRVTADNGSGTTTSSIYRFTTRVAPGNPYGLNAWQNVTGSLNITWTKADSDDYTLVVMNQTAYPTSITTGNVIYNGTLSYYNDTQYNATNYYTLFAFNTTYSIFSSGVQLVYGSMSIYAYDENTSADIGFDCLVSNPSGSETFERLDAINPLTIDISGLPTGDDITILISNDSYESRQYVMDIEENVHYTIYAYLLRTTQSELYQLNVIDENDDAVEDAKMEIKHYINDSYGWEDVTILLTDANGYAEVYLQSGELYKITITKTGFQGEISNYIPSDLIFTKTFKLLFETTTTHPDEVIPEQVTFEGYIYPSTSTLQVNYTDKMAQTINTTIVVYEIESTTGQSAIFATSSNNDNDDFTYSVVVNISNAYVVLIHYNHSTWSYQILALSFESADASAISSEEKAGNIFGIFGYNPFGWSNLFMVFFFVACVFSFGRRGAGIGLIITGGLFLFIGNVIGFNTTLLSMAGGIMPVLFIIIGIMMLWRDSKKEAIG